MKKNTFIFLTCLVATAVIGCAGGKSSKPDPNDIITIGNGGGFSGAYSGFRITRTGEVASWMRSTATAKDSVLARSMTTPDSVEFFFRYLDEIGFTGLQYDKSGNMTFFVEHSLPSPHRLSWADSPEGGPPELSVFYRLVMMYVSRQLHP
ncbi:MAG: hypothetical protein JSS75_03780 [Bacteroidetes bacterium]|nr:hypothetical protein [Bacteroidota bacterium]